MRRCIPDVPLKAGLKHWSAHWLSNDHWSACVQCRGFSPSTALGYRLSTPSFHSGLPALCQNPLPPPRQRTQTRKVSETGWSFSLFSLFRLLSSSSLAFLLDPPPLLCRRVRVTPTKRSSRYTVVDDISIEFPFGQRPFSVAGPTRFR